MVLTRALHTRRGSTSIGHQGLVSGQEESFITEPFLPEIPPRANQVPSVTTLNDDVP